MIIGWCQVSMAGGQRHLVFGFEHREAAVTVQELL
jgi:hypothetical protein